MRIRLWQLQLAGLLMLMAAMFYLVRWILFPGAIAHSEMLRFLVGDVAFLFLQVLLVTVFIDGVSQQREKDEMRQKLNMVIGAFFSQAGIELLGLVAMSDEALSDARSDLVARGSWKAADYRKAKTAFANHDVRIDLTACGLSQLKSMLSREKPYLLGLLGNSSLLEHQQFTDLLWAVTHVAEELEARTDLTHLTRPDLAHLAGDVKRAYLLLGEQWIDYLGHLHTHYPYLFSLAIRTNPLDPEAQAAIAD